MYILHQENRSPCNEVEISGSPWYTDLNGLPQVLLISNSFPQETYFPDIVVGKSGRMSETSRRTLPLLASFMGKKEQEPELRNMVTKL